VLFRSVTQDEVAAFKEAFQVPPEELKNVGRLFDQARRDAGGFEPYARQVASLFRGNPAVLEELLDGLFHIARADGKVTDDELEFLSSVAEIFGIDRAGWERSRATNLSPDGADPYGVIGVNRNADDAKIKSAYRKLVVENHPDKLVAQGMPPEFVAMANEKLAKINAAYDQIRKQRRLD
jgi:DnaJ like chaperone protein